MGNKDITQRKKIIFLFDKPPKVSKGAFNWLSENWGEDVYYFYLKDFEEYRKAANWNDSSFGKAKFILLDDAGESILDELFKETENIFIFSGFLNEVAKKFLDKAIERNHNVIVFTERPNHFGGLFVKLARKISHQYKYRKLMKKYQNKLAAFLPLGQKGVEEYQRYGYKNDNIYPFMYNPEICVDRQLQARRDNQKVRFLYVGRFYFHTKGVDILMRAFNGLKDVDYEVDMVGGYGKHKDDILKWINNNEKVNFGGTWDSTQVATKMQDYDVVIVPSRYDGWNLIPNEAIHANIGVICSDQAASNELIEYGKCGMVYQANSVEDLRKCLLYVINNPQTLTQWKLNAKDYVDKISSKTVGKYLMDIIEYEVYGVGEKPVCPWMVS